MSRDLKRNLNIYFFDYETIDLVMINSKDIYYQITLKIGRKSNDNKNTRCQKRSS